MKTPVLTPKILLLPAIFATRECHAGSANSPTIDVLGSYFPAWMVCIVIGIVITLVVRLLLLASGIHSHLRPKSLVYPCMILFFTLAIWLMFFRN